MSWRRLANLVAWLPAGSWWQRMEHPPTRTNGHSHGGGQQRRVIDANTDPDAARAFFTSIAPLKTKARR